MKHLILILALSLASSLVCADTAYKSYKATAKVSEVDGTWAKEYGPWDFSGMIGFYSPGVAVEGLGAYRVLDSVLAGIDDSLSVESGLGILSVNETIVGTGVSYTAFEIPIMGRWDFRIPDSAFMAGPRIGFNYLTGGTTTINGVSYSTRGGGLYFQVGGYGMFRLTDQFFLRADVAFGGYTTLKFGVTYAL